MEFSQEISCSMTTKSVQLKYVYVYLMHIEDNKKHIHTHTLTAQRNTFSTEYVDEESTFLGF